MEAGQIGSDLWFSTSRQFFFQPKSNLGRHFRFRQKIWKYPNLLSVRPTEEDDDHQGDVGPDPEAPEGQEDGGAELLQQILIFKNEQIMGGVTFDSNSNNRNNKTATFKFFCCARLWKLV